MTSAPVPAPSRPAAVTVAFGLQVVAVLALLAYVVVSSIEVVRADDPVDGSARTADPLVAIIRSLPGSLPAVLLALSAVGLLRGRLFARPLALAGFGMTIGFGLLACCWFIPLSQISENPQNDPFFGDLDRGSPTGVSEWSVTRDVISFAALIVVMVCAITAFVLLLTPAVKRFFDPPDDFAARWQPDRTPLARPLPVVPPEVARDQASPPPD